MKSRKAGRGTRRAAQGAGRTAPAPAAIRTASGRAGAGRRDPPEPAPACLDGRPGVPHQARALAGTVPAQ